MADVQDRPFARDYSGLVNQTVIAGVILAVGATSFEIMKRARRGKHAKSRWQMNKDGTAEGMGSVETWGFGYLYNGRTWSNNPSPPSESRFPLYSWIKQAILMPEEEFYRLRGIDATFYVRMILGCLTFCLIQTCTTLPILLPIHILFSTPDVARKSLLRASISSLTATSGERFFVIHVILSYFIVISWTATLLFCARTLFRYRAKSIREQLEQSTDEHLEHHPNRGLRWRTVMVTNIPISLRKEQALEEYFHYYLSKPDIHAPITQTVWGKTLSLVFRRARNTAAHIMPAVVHGAKVGEERHAPRIERVVIVRKLTELAALMERREVVIRKLELAHLKLAKKALQAVKCKLEGHASPSPRGGSSLFGKRNKGVDEIKSTRADVSKVISEQNAPLASLPSMEEDQLVRALAPFVYAYKVPCPHQFSHNLNRFWQKSDIKPTSHTEYLPASSNPNSPTVWDAMYHLPRPLLDPYQPLVRLRALFRGSTVPAIDYYTAKLNLLTNMIEENRSKRATEFAAASTAFVSFETPAGAVRACRVLASHPDNPLNCLCTPAPDVMDLDWIRVMKSAFSGEWIRDWVVSAGVWTFTCLWIIPVSLFVSLVSIQNIAAFIPPLRNFLDKNPFLENFISNFLPTLLVSILAILIPLVLLLIAKKANLILTYSALHDRIMVRYHKFLVCNLMVFFCVGVTALESILTALRTTLKVQFVNIIADAYPTAGPFYVGWLIFTTGIHGGLELGLIGLPLLVYPSTRRTPLPRKRAIGIRPRTLNFYYWLPNHVFVMFIVVVFSVLNPLVIPFAFIYFCVKYVVIRNQLIHVYAKPYEGNGRNLLIRFTRYSMDGLMLAQIVLLAFMLLNDRVPHAVFLGILLLITIIIKLFVTRLFTRKFIEADLLEAEIACGIKEHSSEVTRTLPTEGSFNFGTRQSRIDSLGIVFSQTAKFWTWRAPMSSPFTYAMRPRRLSEKKSSVGQEAEKSQTEGLLRPRILEARAGGDSAGTVDRNEGATGRRYGAAEGADFSGASGPAVFAAPTTSALEARRQGKLFTAHAPHPNWDDTPRYDISYDNPYYTRVTENFLWLPRDPFGTLDLDDTVDLHRAISTEPKGDEIGKWLNELGSARGLSTGDLMNDAPEHPPETVSPGLPRLPTGRENIILPDGIASRVNVDEDIEDADPPSPASSIFVRTRSRSSSRPSIGQRSSSNRSSQLNPSMFDMKRTMTSNETFTASRPEYPSSLTRRARSASVDNATMLEGGSSFLLTARNRQPSAGTLNRITENAASGVTGEETVTTQQAVEGEALAEEEIAREEREREEEEEKEKTERSKAGWLTGWMWTRQ